MLISDNSSGVSPDRGLSRHWRKKRTFFLEQVLIDLKLEVMESEVSEPEVPKPEVSEPEFLETTEVYPCEGVLSCHREL